MSQVMVSHALLYIENENLKEQLLQNCRQIIGDLSTIIKTLEKGKD